MRGSDFTKWMTCAFHHTQAVLLQEIIKPRAYVSEELVRTALVHGLVQSKPSEAHRIDVEGQVSWSGNQCWFNQSHGSPGKGRTIQHDVIVEAADGDPGAACEVKWLKGQKAKAVAQDVWKLALSRSNRPERKALRTFLLIGGERKKLSETTRYLEDNGKLNVNWSKRGGRRPGLPRPTDVSLESFLKTATGKGSLVKLIAWGKHHRTPPPCLRSLRLTARASWELTVQTHGWALCLLELHRHGASPGSISWSAIKPTITSRC